MITTDTLSTCIRPMIKTSPGKKLVVADLSAIENRALMWLSGCDEGLKVYADGKDPYIDFGVRLFGVPYDSITKAQRQLCKPAVLGCGYGLGPGQERQLANGQIELTGLRKYAQGLGVTLDARQSAGMVNTFREEFYPVVEYWRYLEQAFYAAVKTGKRQQVGAVYLGMVKQDALYIELPSGRRLYYMNPRAWQGAKGIEIRFDGLRNGQWWSVTAWGGVLCENVVQGFSRDVLVEGMFRAEGRGLPIVLHSHDELGAEVDADMPKGLATKMLVASMSEPIDWAPGLPLAAEGWEGERYEKR